jgi:hypothetical protein
MELIYNLNTNDHIYLEANIRPFSRYLVKSYFFWLSYASEWTKINK